MDRLEIKDWLKKYNVENYTINEDLSIDVVGNFNCNDNKLTNLVGCPVSIGGNFSCGSNCLESFFGCLLSVGGNFECSSNLLTSLEGCPVSIGGDFKKNRNRISDSELYLYDYTAEQVKGYYENKNLNKVLQDTLNEESGIGVKKKKL